MNTELFDAPVLDDTYSVTVTWSGGGTPPSPVYIEEGPRASWSFIYSATNPQYLTGTASGTADDGQGDTQTTNNSGSGSYSGFASGPHLRQITSSSGSFTVSSEVKSSVTAACNYPNEGGSGSVGVGYGWGFDTRGLSVGSNTGTTYYCDANGDQQPNKQHSDGGLTVDTVVHWLTSDSYWYGGMNLSASMTSALANDSPTFQWQSSGSGSEVPGTIDGSNTSSFAVAWNLGSDPKASFPQNTEFTVKATDPKDGAQASGTAYGIWHLPEEKYVITSGPTPGNRIVSSDSVSLAPNTSNTFQIPKDEGYFNNTGMVQGAGLFLAISGSLLPLAELSVPQLAGAQAIASGLSYEMGSYQAPPAPTDSVTATANYDEFCADVNMQVQMNNNPGSGQFVRFTPPSKAPAIQAQLQSDPANWDSDPYFQASSATVEVGRYTQNYGLTGQGYGTNGYTGPVSQNAVIDQAYFTVFEWSSTYGPPS